MPVPATKRSFLGLSFRSISALLLCSNKREERLVDLALPISYLRMLFSICSQERLLFVGEFVFWSDGITEVDFKTSPWQSSSSSKERTGRWKKLSRSSSVSNRKKEGTE